MRVTQAGIPRSDMEIHANGQADDALAADTHVEQPPAATTEGSSSKIGRFFSNLFGGDEPPAEIGHYQEAVRRGGAVLTVTVVDEANVSAVRSALYEAGAVDIDERVTQWQNAGYQGYDPSTAQYSADETAAERQSFAVVRESLDVGKREVQTGGVRVYSRATETPVSEAVSLREEHAAIERHPVDRIATADDLKAGSVEVLETAEHAVVGKTAHVVEEVTVGKQASERTETINETLRGTEVEVERLDGKAPGTPANSADLPPTTRQ
ncbi:YsnF/AvaK domain-containing protein [Paraburkholderia aromaticivorans]|uniref:YsnF/AvaK domain-containing protein n=1 Tax=Paraburkholderia aromaticivorans TaxID=2026199 RepID=UPI001F0E0E38|nr:YsnF/AvaK domain-containing protein [Paraburkholderia aromaticivorans]